MHPLSVEDVLHLGSHTLSKVDYYPKHLFICILCHIIDSANGTSQFSTMAAGSTGLSSSLPFTNIPHSASPQHFNIDEKPGTADEGIDGKFYRYDANLMMDVFKAGRIPSVNPEMGGCSASILI